MILWLQNRKFFLMQFLFQQKSMVYKEKNSYTKSTSKEFQISDENSYIFLNNYHNLFSTFNTKKRMKKKKLLKNSKLSLFFLVDSLRNKAQISHRILCFFILFTFLLFTQFTILKTKPSSLP